MFEETANMTNVVELLFFLLIFALAFCAAFFAIELMFLSIPIYIGAAVQLLLVFFVRRRWLWSIPSLLGVLGIAGCCFYNWPDLPFLPLLLYWGFYYFVLCMMWILASQIKKRVIEECSP